MIIRDGITYRKSGMLVKSTAFAKIIRLEVLL